MANIALSHLTEELQHRFDLPSGFRQRDVHSLFTSGIAAVDQALRGGFPRATLSEISGPPSSNRTALAISTLAHAYHAGECCAWIDSSGTLDPQSASVAGIQLSSLLWINCRGHAENALKATDLLLHGGGFGLIVFDMADIPESVARRIPMASWFRLRHAAEETRTALIVLTSRPQTRSCSALCVELTRRRSIWRGRLFRGVVSVVENRRHTALQKTCFESVL
jgi:hypothetical protein